MPAATSSIMIPSPPRNRSNCRAGHGFTTSNRRKNTNANKTCRISTGHAARAHHCPATSSMTTYPGSSLPLSRSMIDPAGMPTRVTVSAATAVASATPVVLRCAARAAKNHTTAATSDAHVPGPGPTSPIPKKVPVIHAQVVRELVGAVVIVPAAAIRI
jgi:hypothetical protein